MKKNSSEGGYKYPSRYASHKSMINPEAVAPAGMVVLTDEHGDYTTFVSRLDNGTADPNRFASERLTKFFDKKAEEKKPEGKK